MEIKQTVKFVIIFPALKDQVHFLAQILDIEVNYMKHIHFCELIPLATDHIFFVVVPIVPAHQEKRPAPLPRTRVKSLRNL